MFHAQALLGHSAAGAHYRPNQCTSTHNSKISSAIHVYSPALLLLQRATIAVHDGKILVKTEIVKAIITADKAVLIKGRWGLGGACKQLLACMNV
jgi:hypothetical protein